MTNQNERHNLYKTEQIYKTKHISEFGNHAKNCGMGKKIIICSNQTNKKRKCCYRKCVSEIYLPPIDSSGMALGSFEAPSVGRMGLNVFNRFMLRRINCTF